MKILPLDFLFKLISFIYPITIFKGKSEFNPCLEVTWYNGKLMLNSSNANYSFGNLHLIFQKAFRDSRLKINQQGKVLLLGLGGGSVPHILSKAYRLNGKITAIEIDPLVIYLYQKYFNHPKNSVVEVICEDARTAVDELPEATFDLIVCDLFIDLDIPSFVLEERFIRSLNRLLLPSGTVYMNIMLNEEPNFPTANEIMQVFFKHFKEVVRLDYHERNLLIVARGRSEQ